jgi:hypothetical protein
MEMTSRYLTTLEAGGEFDQQVICGTPAYNNIQIIF